MIHAAQGAMWQICRASALECHGTCICIL